ncbi:oxidoreductase [Granulicella sibirica]|uniref:Oxidoreductase n=1 Tax=Granulicella sibirica TaxID=2479048 RepID=A0A4Q0SXD2_9BACT|nr:oxidoreductase [Granulicella sibirica]
MTGASGFLGGRLAEVLAARGEDVVILARAKSDLKHLAGTKVRVVRGDLSDAAALGEAVRDATQIFHCAACSTDWASWKTYFDANVVGTKNLLAAARGAAKLERFVHVSTTDVYGYPVVPCGEEHPIVDAGLPYNQTKGQGEALVWKAFREDGLPVTVVRPATIYGPRGKDFTVEIGEMLRLRLMATIDGGRAPGGFAYVDNVVDGMLAAAASGSAVGEAYNLCDGTGATWLEYLRLFAARLKTPMPWINLSFRAADSLAGVLQIPHRLLRLGGRPLLTRHAVILLGRDQEFPIAKAVREFGFRPLVSLEEGIERSAGWLRSRSR